MADHGPQDHGPQDRKRVACPLCNSTNSRPERIVAGQTLEKCVDCGLVFLNPQPPTTDVVDLYTDRDAEYLTTFYNRSATPAILTGYHHKLADLERRLGRKGRMLDFGCAAGFFTQTAAVRGWDALGIDLGRWTRAAAESRGFHGVRVGTLDSMNFAPGSFDLVNASQVFEHLPTPRILLSELVRLLRSGGLLAIDVPNYHTLPILLNRDDFLSNAPPEHLNYFTPRTLRRLLHGDGLRVLKVATEGGLKWENLFGRPVKSEIREAHQLTRSLPKDVPAPPVAAQPPTPAGGRGSRFKRSLLRTLVRPVLYDALGLGMKLYAVARKTA
jgi:SAM-dependent methyltransferase